MKHLAQLPKSPVTLCGPGTYQPTREKKTKAAQCYLSLFQYLLPTLKSIASSHLWHKRFARGEHIVTPSKPTEIVGFTDWQSAEAAPLYFQARQPHLVDYVGPPVRGLERPRLQADSAQLDPDTEKEAKILYLEQSLCSLYKTPIHRDNPRLFEAFETQHIPSFTLLLLARNLLFNGEAAYLAQVAELETECDTIADTHGAEFPTKFSESERAEIGIDMESAARGMEAMRSLQDSLGDIFPEKGLVRKDQYDDTVEALQQIREQVVDEFARNEQDKGIWRRVWPFTDWTSGSCRCWFE